MYIHKTFTFQFFVYLKGKITPYLAARREKDYLKPSFGFPVYGVKMTSPLSMQM